MFTECWLALAIWSAVSYRAASTRRIVSWTRRLMGRGGCELGGVAFQGAEGGGFGDVVLFEGGEVGADAES
ncbi:hypothetical protein CP979_36100 [Streptomyces filamentosus]|nr:hypothetical protein CP979_36100 [Streptomyces filamentosus]